MQKWQYLIVHVHSTPNDSGTALEAAFVVQGDAGINLRERPTSDLVSALHMLGELGWELVAVVAEPTGHVQRTARSKLILEWTFKQPK